MRSRGWDPQTPYKLVSTRAASIYRAMTCSSPTHAIPLDLRALAPVVGCSYARLKRVTGKLMREKPWVVQYYHIVIFLRPSTRRRPHPQFFVIRQHRLGTIGGGPRNHLRRKDRRAWIDHVRWLKKLVFAVLKKRFEGGKGQYKALPSAHQAPGAMARPPPEDKNRPGFRRHRKIAWALVSDEAESPSASKIPRIRLYGWIEKRLAENHSFDRVRHCLAHAVSLVPTGERAPKNRHAWIQAVAARHLDWDGLHPSQRRGKWKRHGADAPAINEDFGSQEQAAPAIEEDRPYKTGYYISYPDAIWRPKELP